MRSKVHFVVQTPVRSARVLIGKALETLGLNWSGREDSNLRPLPPEGVSPSVTQRFSVVRGLKGGAYPCVRSRAVHARRFGLNLEHCLSGPARLPSRGASLVTKDKSLSIHPANRES